MALPGSFTHGVLHAGPAAASERGDGIHGKVAKAPSLDLASDDGESGNLGWCVMSAERRWERAAKGKRPPPLA